jgi:type I restriction enzyme S subunit
MVRQGYKHTEVGVIPEDWDVKQIGDLEPFVTSGSRGWAAFYSEYGSPFIRITNLSRTCIYPNLQDLRFVNLAKNESEAARTQLHDGDVLISITADIGIVGHVTHKLLKPAYINQHIALVRFDSTRTNSRFVSYFLASENPQKRFRALTDSGAKAGMNLATVQQVPIALPPTKAEQEAIAEALSDADALIESLEKLLAKKRQIKQGAMQELLTGERRLPGFGGEWKVKQLKEVAHIKTGGRNNQDKVEDGEYPFFVRSATVERINSFSYDCAAILIPGEGGIGSIFHYITGRFDVHQRVYAITQFSANTSGKFVYFYMARSFGAHAMENSVKATVDSLRLPTFQNFGINLPPTLAEQTAIAAVLSDMDAAITILEAKLTKARQIKQGMMQELLTGRIRLV